MGLSGGAGNYYALYPKSWYEYRWEKLPANVTLEQFSPVLPDNYRESSYPVAVYRWHAENTTKQNCDGQCFIFMDEHAGMAAISFADFAGRTNAGNQNHFVSEPGAGGTVKAVVFDRLRPRQRERRLGWTVCHCNVGSPGVEVSYQTTYFPDRGGNEVWAPFSKDGRLANDSANWVSSGETLAGAIAVRFTLKPGEKKVVPMVVSWDLPIIEFGTGRRWYRHYTDFYGTNGINALKIASEALKNAAAWSDAIDAWQAPYVSDEKRPDWYRGALFNELYILADGGSFWGGRWDPIRRRRTRFLFWNAMTIRTTRR